MSGSGEAAQVSSRLLEMGRLADLRPGRRLAAKIDLSATGVTRRLRRLSELRDCGLAWARWGRPLVEGPERKGRG